MRRFPDFPDLAARALLLAALPCLVLGVVWLARTKDDTRLGRGVVPAPEIATPNPRDYALEPVKRDELAGLGRSLWESYVPDELKARYAFPSHEEIGEFLARLEQELSEGSAAQLAAYERDARRALKTLRHVEGGAMVAAWLEPRLDFLRAAVQIEGAPTNPPPVTSGAIESPPASSVIMEAGPTPMVPVATAVRPQFTRDYWDRVMEGRQPPRRAAAFVPRLKEIFHEAGLPVELVWIAEVESAMDPEATSPVGARGLFQFMPLTAARFGLDAGVLVDERTHPEKSAKAAAAYLRILHRQFRSWPLALAAYNAGEGRVGRALLNANATTFEGVAHRLPLETRMYVPKVMATLAVREAIDPEKLPDPVPVPLARARFVRDGGDPEVAPPTEATGSSAL